MQVMYHLCSKNTIPIIQIEPAFSGKLDKCYANYNTSCFFGSKVVYYFIKVSLRCLVPFP